MHGVEAPALHADHLDSELQELAGLDLKGLRTFWRERHGLPPRLRSSDLLRRRLAWRLQADALGGLDAETSLELRRRHVGPPAHGNRRPAGTRLVREYQGERHEVTITETGVSYRGDAYASLSEVARAITGVRWNGPRFFGLRGGG